MLGCEQLLRSHAGLTCFLPQGEKLLRSFVKSVVLKSEQVFLPPSHTSEQRVCFALNDKMCVLTSIRQKTAIAFSPAGGQIASSFIMSWHSP